MCVTVRWKKIFFGQVGFWGCFDESFNRLEERTLAGCFSADSVHPSFAGDSNPNLDKASTPITQVAAGTSK
uniref:Uncharacterized protein n=1 Tax=Sphaerodactylus townsendi TaxID=933632 RepID=A0ACB8G667_9SAUR